MLAICFMTCFVTSNASAQTKTATVKLKPYKNKAVKARFGKKGKLKSFKFTSTATVKVSPGEACSQEGKDTTEWKPDSYTGTCTAGGKTYNCRCAARVTFKCVDGKQKFQSSIPTTCEIEGDALPEPTTTKAQ